MSAPIRKRQRRRILEHERVRIATARFESVRSSGIVTPLAELASRFGRNEAVVSRVIADALRSGMVEVRIVGEDERTPERDPHLEQELVRKYRNLLSAVVVKVKPSTGAPLSSETTLAYSDSVHRVLGRALAIEIARGTLIKNGEHIGIGPGRGVCETVRALHREPPLRARGVTLTSLSGVGYLRHHARNRNLLLDPDYMAVSLSEVFEEPVALDLVSSILVVDDTMPRTTLPRAWLGTDIRNRRPIDTAILGVGALIPGNRFYEEALQSGPNQEPVYAPIRESLRSLLRSADPLRTSDYIPVGDIGYHLFFVSPPAGMSLSAEARALIARQIDSINNRLLSAHAPDFRQMRSAILVAGTPVKARAIHHLLTGNLAPVSHLCTDLFTAHLLISL
jgi:DNA-binding transcriptional regulator LsrR (DeoR family)